MPMRLALLVLGTIVLVGVCEGSSNFLTNHPYVRGTGLGLLLLAIAGWWLRDARARMLGRAAAAWPAATERAVSLLVAVVPTASIAFAVMNRGRGVFLVPPWITFAILAGAIGSCLSLVPRMPTVVPLGACVLAGLGLRAFDFLALPIDARRADMLPLVGAAVTRLLDGHDPYVLYGMPWPLPLTYLPLTWLAYVPAVLLGIDMRWTSAACELALLALLWRAAGRGARPLLLLFGAWFASTALPFTDAITAMAVQTCALTAASVLVAVRSRGASVAVGVAAATTPLTGALLPIIAVAWWREGGARIVLKRSAVAAAVFALLVVPWVIGNPRGFWVGPVRWFNNIDGFPRRMWDELHAWAAMPGLTGLFWTLGWERLLRVVQAVLVGSIAVLVTLASGDKSSIDPLGWMQASLATMVAFVAFNVIVWPYHYEPVAALALGALAVALRARSESSTSRSAESPATTRPSNSPGVA